MLYICDNNNLKSSSSPGRGPEEIYTIGVCSFQDLGDLGQQKCKSRIFKIDTKVQLLAVPIIEFRISILNLETGNRKNEHYHYFVLSK